MRPPPISTPVHDEAHSTHTSHPRFLLLVELLELLQRFLLLLDHEALPVHSAARQGRVAHVPIALSAEPAELLFGLSLLGYQLLLLLQEL